MTAPLDLDAIKATYSRLKYSDGALVVELVDRIRELEAALPELAARPGRLMGDLVCMHCGVPVLCGRHFAPITNHQESCDVRRVVEGRPSPHNCPPDPCPEIP